MPGKDECESCQRHLPESPSSWVCRTELSNPAALCSEYSFEGCEGHGVSTLCV